MPLRLFLLLLALTACAAPTARVATDAVAPTISVRVAQSPLAAQESCTDGFVAHNLGIADGVRMREIGTYASNGAGVAAGDLDGDGDLDLVFASIDRESTILWNQGALEFVAEPLDDQFTRAVAIVDVDGDGALDIAFTHRGIDGVSFWRNGGPASVPRFSRTELPGVSHYAYAMAWADLNGDDALDLVTGAYDAELKNHGISAEEMQARGGIVVYEQRDGVFVPTQLTPRAEALAIGLVDLDGDDRLDIWVANDFALPDGHWSRQAGIWREVQPFRQTSHSTMSIDWGDIANDGTLALFTTDMNPGDLAPDVLAAWLPVISRLEEKHGPFDPQIMANVLQVRQSNGAWRNEAPQRGVDATGWSWSGRFGDLDNDGFLDLYVVNGMIATNLFAHLPNNELVERNHALRNRGDGNFVAVPEWNLGATASGRGMFMADMDNDGDLDIVVNNLRAAAQLFENRLCGGDGMLVDVRWSGSANTHAIGAQLELHTSHGVMRRDIRATSGYLAGDAARVHFGVPRGATIERLDIHFPDGAIARILRPAPQSLIEVTR